MWLIEWIKENSQEIITLLTSANFVALVAMIAKFIFNAKQTKLLKDNLKNLTTDLSKIADTKDEISYNSKSNANLVERVSSLEAQLIANNKALEAMLSVMGIVYMRAKDEDVRSSVASILSTYKTGDVTVRNLKLEIEDLKEKLAGALSKLTEIESEDTSSEANTVVSDPEVKEEVLMRG